MAGAGTGKTPCAISTMPAPRFNGDATTSSMPNHSNPNTAPTMSTIESTAPTSCRWTSSIDIWWIAASASPIRRKRSTARSLPEADNADWPMSFEMSASERCP